MPKYCKKPIVVEAIQLGWDTWSEVCEFVPKDQFVGGVYLHDETYEILYGDFTSNTMGLIIKTLEGDMLARQGDFVIKGIRGECYPCKPDIFHATYDLVEE